MFSSIQCIQVLDKHKVDLLWLLTKHGDVHHILTEIFIASSTQVIEKMSVQDFDRLAETESARVDNIFGILLKKQYPNLHPDMKGIPFDNLLQWHLWPNFIKRYGIHDYIRPILEWYNINFNIYCYTRKRIKVDGKASTGVPSSLLMCPHPVSAGVQPNSEW